MLAGEWWDGTGERLAADAAPNVRVTGRLSDEDLDALFASSAVYVQASLHEGFGLSLAEAMLAGAVPVVTSAGALPEVVGETGRHDPRNRRPPRSRPACARRSSSAPRPASPRASGSAPSSRTRSAATGSGGSGPRARRRALVAHIPSWRIRFAVSSRPHASTMRPSRTVKK